MMKVLDYPTAQPQLQQSWDVFLEKKDFSLSEQNTLSWVCITSSSANAASG